MSKEPKKEENNFNKAVRSPFHIEIDSALSGISVSVCGVAAILSFTENEVLLKLKKGKLKLTGNKFDIAVYENKTVEIVGRIGEIAII